MAENAEAPIPPPSERAVRLRRFWSDYADEPTAVAALAVFALIVVLAVLAPWIAPTNPYDIAKLDILDARQPPGAQSMDGMTFWLGTDPQGRDMLSAILYGMRISLVVGATSGVLALCIGVAVGLVAAALGGRVETLIMRLVDFQLSFPVILVALILLAALGRGVDKVILALVAVQWTYYCRTVRASALVEMEKEYVHAASGLGLGRTRILFRHLLPNCLPPVIVLATVQIANSIALEATLSFLGLGLPPTEPSLGLLIANGFDYMLSRQYWISFLPGAALLIIIVAINVVGDRLRDVLNPRLSR
ncbi:MAG: ABC transporter permease [Alphaproteobacteria bacterium]|nr:ABC transporter permease [Alphaproteobacteria bacterium]